MIILPGIATVATSTATLCKEAITIHWPMYPLAPLVQFYRLTKLCFVIQKSIKPFVYCVRFFLSVNYQMIPIYFDPSRTIDSNLMTWNSTLVQQQIQPQQMQQQEPLQQSFNFQQQQQLPQFVIQPQQQDAGLWPSNSNNNIANQQWDSELTEDLFRMVMNELDANQPAVQPTLIEVNPQHTDDDILAGIWEINDFTTDAVSASNNNTIMEDRLARRINQMTLSDDNNQKQKEQQSPPYPGKNTKTYPHSIAMGLARALRSYAVTGNMTHILMRLHHLFAIQSEDGDK